MNASLQVGNGIGVKTSGTHATPALRRLSRPFRLGIINSV
jgi:hypothetical protein